MSTTPNDPPVQPPSVQDSTDHLDRELRLALAPTFASNEDFLDRIRRGIDSRKNEEAERQARLEAASSRLQMAAGLLPPGLLPRGLVLGAGKQLGAKGLAVTLATPALSFVMVVITLIAGLRSARKSPAKPEPGLSGKNDKKERQALVTAWWKRNRRPALFSIGLVTLLALLGSPETALLAVLLSTAAAVLLLAEFARAGISDSSSVCHWTAGLLWNLGIYAFLLRGVLPRGSGASNPYTTNAILLLGAGLCMVLRRPLTWQRIKDAFDSPVQRLSQRDAPTVFCLRALMGVLTCLIGLALLFFISEVAFGFVPHKPSRDRLEAQVRSFHEPAVNVSQWNMFEQALDLLSQGGAELPDLTLPSQTIHTSLGNEDPFFGPAERVAVRFGLLGDSGLKRWTESYLAKTIQDGTIETIEPESNAVFLYALLRIGALDQNARTHLAQLLEASWPEPEARRVLSEMRVRVDLLAALGEEERIAAHEEDIHLALKLAWPATHQRWRPTRAFLWDQRSARKWINATRGDRFDPDAWEPTNDALALAAHVGMPEEIEIASLRGSLAGALQATRFGELFGLSDSNAMGVEVTALQLDQLYPMAKGWTFLNTLVEERLFLATLGLVTLCLMACSRSLQQERPA